MALMIILVDTCAHSIVPAFIFILAVSLHNCNVYLCSLTIAPNIGAIQTGHPYPNVALNLDIGHLACLPPRAREWGYPIVYTTSSNS